MKKIVSNLQSDFPSAIVVFLVAIPLCLGIAMASGVPEFSGIIAGIVGGILVGALSGSQLSVSGPAAGLTAIVAAAVLKLPAIEAFFLAVVLAGVIQIIMGVLKLGIIGHYVPNSVIKGMLAAIGIILILKQIPLLVGYNATFEGDESFKQASGNTFSSFISAFSNITPLAMFIGITGLGILTLYETKWMKGKKMFSLLNGPLMVVLIGVLMHRIFGPRMGTLEQDMMVNLPVPDSFSSFVGLFNSPDFGFLSNPDVWLTAVTLALVASLETLLGIEAVDKLDPEKRVTPNNRELVAQGSGNIVSGLLGGLPLTSVIVRSSANINAGAKSKASAIIHGLLILFCVTLIPGILNMIPKAALAAVLIFTGYKLAKVSLFLEYYRKGWNQFVPFVITISAIVLTDLLTGVMIGLVAGIFYVLRDNFRTAITSVKENNKYLISLRKDVSFFSKSVLLRTFSEIPENSSVLIDMSRAEFVDRDIRETISEFEEHAKHMNIKVVLKGRTGNALNGIHVNGKLKNNKLADYSEIATGQIYFKP